MSIHNAINRRRTPQSKKHRDHQRRARKSLRWGKGRMKKWTRLKRVNNRRERRSAKARLQPISRTYNYVEEGQELLTFRQVEPRSYHYQRNLRSDSIINRVRAGRNAFKDRCGHTKEERRKYFAAA